MQQKYRPNSIKTPNFNNEQRLSNNATTIIGYSIQSSFAEVAVIKGLTKKSRDAGTPGQRRDSTARRPGVVLSGPSRPIMSY